MAFAAFLILVLGGSLLLMIWLNGDWIAPGGWRSWFRCRTDPAREEFMREARELLDRQKKALDDIRRILRG